MMTWDQNLLFALATWPACGTIAWTAICRLNAMGRDVLFRVVLEYAIYIAIAAGIFLAPTVGEWPGWVMVCVAYGVAIIMLCQWRAWAGDKPPVSATGRMPLYPHPPEDIAR